MRYLGIDNGVTGSLAVLNETGQLLAHVPTPVFKQLNYTKSVSWITRVDVPALKALLIDWGLIHCFCAIERPFVNPKGFKATVSALRCLEATQIVLEELGIGYEWLDSRDWQKAMLPKGLEKGETKKASNDICHRLFPAAKLKNPGAGDSILIAEFIRRRHNSNFPAVRR